MDTTVDTAVDMGTGQCPELRNYLFCNKNFTDETDFYDP